MELARTEARFFGLARLPLVEIPHHPSGGARAGEHRADAEGALDRVHEELTLGAGRAGEPAVQMKGREAQSALGGNASRQD